MYLDSDILDCRRIASGRFALVGTAGRVLDIVDIDDIPDFGQFDYDDGPTCSICDALGHGYPGGRPCPLEERGAYEADLQDRWEAANGVIPFDVAMAQAEAVR